MEGLSHVLRPHLGMGKDKRQGKTQPAKLSVMTLGIVGVREMGGKLLYLYVKISSKKAF